MIRIDQLRKTSLEVYIAAKGTLELVLSSFRFQPRRNKQEAPFFYSPRFKTSLEINFSKSFTKKHFEICFRLLSFSTVSYWGQDFIFENSRLNAL